MTEHFLDARGLICPLPVLKARKALLGLQPGDLLHIQVTDKAAPKDFGLFCGENGHTLCSVEEQGPTIEILVRRGDS